MINWKRLQAHTIKISRLNFILSRQILRDLQGRLCQDVLQCLCAVRPGLQDHQLRLARLSNGLCLGQGHHVDFGAHLPFPVSGQAVGTFSSFSSGQALQELCVEQHRSLRHMVLSRFLRCVQSDELLNVMSEGSEEIAAKMLVRGSPRILPPSFCKQTTVIFYCKCQFVHVFQAISPQCSLTRQTKQ